MIYKKTAIILLSCCFFICGSAEAVPRGIRQNNPGNIRAKYIYEYAAWPNAMGVDDDHYLTFKRPVDGIRAIVINLRCYWFKHHIRTPWGIISRWTYREGDSKTREQYVALVCSRLGGVDSYCRLDMNDPKVLKAITMAIIYFENGVDPYKESTYKKVFP